MIKYNKKINIDNKKIKNGGSIYYMPPLCLLLVYIYTEWFGLGCTRRQQTGRLSPANKSDYTFLYSKDGNLRRKYPRIAEPIKGLS
jgi:hypothetical protein